MAGNNWMGGWTGSGVALPAPASASFGNGSMGAFATARLDRPDRALRKIAIKQMMGQQLTANEIDRLARRQGVEARYEEAGNNNFGKMDSAYARAGVPVMIRQRLGAEGSTLGSMAARYGEDGVGDVQRLNRERLMRESELGNLRLGAARFEADHRQELWDRGTDAYNRNATMSDLNLDAARFAAAHRQEDYDRKAQIADANLRAAEMRNSEFARKISEAESGRNALMNVDKEQMQREQMQIDAVPSSLLDRRYLSPYVAVDAGISAALKNNDFGAYAALLERRNAMAQADEKARAEASKTQKGTKITKHEQVAEAYDFYTRKIEDAIANGRQDEAAFYERAREALIAQRGNAGTSTGTDAPIYNNMNQQNGRSRGAVPLSTAAGGKKEDSTGNLTAADLEAKVKSGELTRKQAYDIAKQNGLLK